MPIDNAMPVSEFQSARLKADREKLEDALAFQMKVAGLPDWEREFQFNPDRKWRFDFAWPEQTIAVECEGGTFSGGRHVRGVGFEKDCEKYNDAAMRGWSCFRYTAAVIEDGRAIQELSIAIESRLRGLRDEG